MNREALLQIVVDRAAAHHEDVILQALDVIGGVVALDMTPAEIARLHPRGASGPEAVASPACSSSSKPDPVTAGP